MDRAAANNTLISTTIPFIKDRALIYTWGHIYRPYYLQPCDICVVIASQIVVRFVSSTRSHVLLMTKLEQY